MTLIQKIFIGLSAFTLILFVCSFLNTKIFKNYKYSKTYYISGFATIALILCFIVSINV